MKVSIGSYKFTKFSDAVAFAMRRYNMKRKEAERYVRELEIKQRASDTKSKKGMLDRLSNQMEQEFGTLDKMEQRKRESDMRKVSKEEVRMDDSERKLYSKLDWKAARDKNEEVRAVNKMNESFRKLQKEVTESEREIKKKISTAALKGAYNKGSGFTGWWMLPSIKDGNIKVVYQPYMATSLQDSYKNLVSSVGKYDAKPGTAPSFDKYTGWRFTAASLQYLDVGSEPPFTTYPMTFIALYRYPALPSTDAGIVGLSDYDGTTSRLLMFSRGSAANDPLVAYAVVDTSAADTLTKEANVWYVGAAVFTASNDRAAYVNGGNKGTSTVNRTSTGLDKMTVGGYYSNSAATGFFNSIIGAIAVYDIALNDEQILDISNNLLKLVRSIR